MTLKRIRCMSLRMLRPSPYQRKCKLHAFYGRGEMRLVRQEKKQLVMTLTCGEAEDRPCQGRERK
jgi:hypothetical protein